MTTANGPPKIMPMQSDTILRATHQERHRTRNATQKRYNEYPELYATLPQLHRGSKDTWACGCGIVS